MPARKRSIRARKALVWWSSSPEEDRTRLAAWPVSAAAVLTPLLLRETSSVPCAACCVLRVISRVAEACCSTAEAVQDAIARWIEAAREDGRPVPEPRVSAA